MNRKTLLALALGSALAVPMFNAYAEGDEEKKPEESNVQWILAEGDEEKKPEESQSLRADGGEEKTPEPAQVIAEGDDDKKEPSKPELLG